VRDPRCIVGLKAVVVTAREHATTRLEKRNVYLVMLNLN
jgi:hypothetical protein